MGGGVGGGGGGGGGGAFSEFKFWFISYICHCHATYSIMLW